MIQDAVGFASPLEVRDAFDKALRRAVPPDPKTWGRNPEHAKGLQATLAAFGITTQSNQPSQ